MANLGLFTINTEKKYVKLSDVIDIELAENTKYIMQAQANDPFYFCVSTEVPEKGGFKTGLDPFTYTPVSGADLYICTYGKLYLNVAI